MQNEERMFAFNRRVVENQTVYVRARSLAEAWRRVRSDEGDNTDDATIISRTYRKLKDHPND